MDFQLLQLIQQDTQLKRTSAHRGGEYHGPCPFCGGRDRFWVQPEKDLWTCRQCNKSGDTVAYLVESGRMTTQEAYAARHGETVNVAKPTGKAMTPPVYIETCEPPNAIWQERAWELIYTSQDMLFSDVGQRALEWLQARGLSLDIIEREFIGLHNVDRYEDRDRWGLNADAKQVWIPRGIVIPWFIGSHIWRVNIRRPVGEPKYIGPAGFGNGLYNADNIELEKPTILVEGELDAVTLMQVAGDIVTPCATGSNGGSRRPRWIAKLAICKTVLLAFDADDAGQSARDYWSGVLTENSRQWKPFYSDVNKMHIDGVNLRDWLIAGLH